MEKSPFSIANNKETNQLIEMISMNYVPCLHVIALHVLQQTHKLTSTLSAVSDYIKELTEKEAAFELKVKEQQSKINQLTKEKEGLLTRLSKLAKTRLTEGNPAIVDVSDENRPQKLGERFSEIYDNEWTDALECLTKSADCTEESDDDEAENVETLLKTAKDCYRFCDTISMDQINILFQHQGNTLGDEQNKGRNKIPKLPEGTMNLLKEIRVTTAPSLLGSLKEKYYAEVTSASTVDYSKKEIRKFADSCLECFWFSVIQNPPVSFGFDVKQYSEYDQSVSRPYTKSGKYVHYNVWPTMYLYNGGPLLTKGIVQCTNTISG